MKGLFKPQERLIADAVTQQAADARAALERGQLTYAPQLSPTLFGGIIFQVGEPGYWGALIDAIEKEGWGLCLWSVAPLDGMVVACPLFRRR